VMGDQLFLAKFYWDKLIICPDICGGDGRPIVFV